MNPTKKLNTRDEYHYSYPELLNNYYYRRIYRLMGRNGNSIFLALIHKANQLKWPTSFPMTNKELSDLSQIGTNTINRSRKTMTDVRVGRKKLIRIIKGNINKPPVYKIAYELLTRRTEDCIYELNTMPYYEYLQTPAWKERRRKAIISAQWRCQLCYRNDLPLHVHHKTYERRGYEDPGDLIVLCSNCHAKFHDKLPDSHEESGAVE